MNKLPAVLPKQIDPNFSSKKLMDMQSLPDDSLPPKNYLDGLIAEIDSDPKIAIEPAAILVKELMQCYPAQNDTRVKSKFFGQQVVLAFADYTEAVCLNARQNILENCKFLPSISEISAALKLANMPRVSAQATAKKFLSVRKDRRLDA